jgi:uncharacterized protein
MRLILDTSAWYSYIFENDKFHEQSKSLIKKTSKLYVAYPVYEEILALFHHRAGKKMTLVGVEALRKSRMVEMVFLTGDEEKEIWDIYKKTFNWLDYVDASVVWLARKMDLPVFGFDSHFEKMKVDMLPKLEKSV